MKWMGDKIFTEMHLVVTNEKYLIWYMNITCQVITPNLKQVSPPGYMQYEQHALQIQNIISNMIFK